MPKVHVPSALRLYTRNLSSIHIPGNTIRDILVALQESCPGVQRHVFHEDGNLRGFVNIYVNEENIRTLAGAETRVDEKDEISIVPSVAGGSHTPDSQMLSHEEIMRYSRHLILPDVAMEGQRKLKQARILVIGAGGLGSPVLMYLAASGIGRLGLVDFDMVAASNLHRQVIYRTDSIGQPKLDAARAFIKGINPNVRVDLHEATFNTRNALDIADDYDIIIDGTDNFPTRYLVNDVSVLLGKPNVYGSIFKFEGQTSVFGVEDGPCYRCLYPEPPAPGLVPSCAEGGVLGVLPGIIGTIQATEAIKLILGTGNSLVGRLVLYDALAMRFREVKLQKDPKCRICGDQPEITELIDYHQFCGVPGKSENNGKDVRDIEISATQLHRKLKTDPVMLVDIREPEEWAIGHIDGAVLIPLGSLPHRLSEVDNNCEIIAYCRSGVRSLHALELLHNAGYPSAKHLRGGILAWSDDVDSSIPKY